MIFLGIFVREVNGIIFTWRGAGEMDVRWGCSHKVRIPMQDDNGHMLGGCKVGMVM